MVSAISTIDQILLWVAGIMVLFTFCFVLWFIWFNKQFKHTIIVRDVLNKRKIVYVDKFRIMNDANSNIKWYQLKKFKEKIPVAPKECLEIGYRGNYFVEAYRLPEGDYIYLKDETSDIENIDKNDNFKPITTQQRVLQFSMFENKMKHKRKSWKDYVIPIAGILSVTVIVISLMIFWGDLAKPVLEMGDKVGGITDKQGEITDKLDEIISRNQLLKDEGVISSNENKPPN